MEPLHVSDIMSPEPMALYLDDSIEEALEEMNISGIHHLPVLDDDGRLAGVVSHRDLLAARDRSTEPVSTLMQRDVKTVSPDTLAHEAAYLLLRHAIGCIPVTDNDANLLGIVTATDFVRIAYTFLGGQVPVEQIEKEEEEAQRL
jgi:CBS domain-containing membrane protein